MTISHPEILLLFSSKPSHKIEQQAIPMTSKKSAKMNNGGIISDAKEKESEKVVDAGSVRSAKTASALKIATTSPAFPIIVSFR